MERKKNIRSSFRRIQREILQSNSRTNEKTDQKSNGAVNQWKLLGWNVFWCFPQCLSVLRAVLAKKRLSIVENEKNESNSFHVKRKENDRKRINRKRKLENFFRMKSDSNQSWRNRFFVERRMTQICFSLLNLIPTFQERFFFDKTKNLFHINET